MAICARNCKYKRYILDVGYTSTPNEISNMIPSWASKYPVGHQTDLQ